MNSSVEISRFFRSMNTDVEVVVCRHQEDRQTSGLLVTNDGETFSSTGFPEACGVA